MGSFEYEKFRFLGKALKTSNGEKLVKVNLLSGVFDAPAKSQFQNLVQFNGEYGCPYCLEPGKTVKVGLRGHTHAFPFNFDSKTGHAKLRTHASTKEHAVKAQAEVCFLILVMCELYERYTRQLFFEWSLLGNII